MACGMALAITMADWFIYLAYDERYHAAAFYLSVLLAGGWFGMLSAFSESILMGIGKPSNVALGNTAKFAAVLALVPLVLPKYGMGAAVMVFAAVEGVRYLVLAFRQRTHGLCCAVRQAVELNTLRHIAQALQTPTGIRRLRKQFRDIQPQEYQLR